MKKFSLFLLGTFFLFQFGCKKDEPIQNDVQGKSRITESIDDNILPLERNACFEIPELCASGPPYVSTPDEPFDPTTSFGPPKVLSLQGYLNNANPIRIKDGNMVYWVYGYEIFENSTDYVVMNQNSEVFFLSETDDPYLQSKNEVGVLSNKLIDVIPLINHENLENGSLTENTIRNNFESNIPLITFPNRKFEIDITNRTPSGNPQARVITWSWCKWVVPATVRKYKKQLMSTYVLTGEDWALDEAIEEAVESCHDNLCDYCTDTRCVVDAMVNNGQISGSSVIVNDIKKNYLRLILDLTDEQVDELGNDSDFLNDIFNFASNCDDLTSVKDAVATDCSTVSFKDCITQEINSDILVRIADETGMSIDEISEFSFGCTGTGAGYENCVKDAILTSIRQRINIPDDKAECLKNNVSRMGQISAFLSKHQGSTDPECGVNKEKNIADAIATIYTDDACEIELNQLSMGDVGNSSDPLWEIMKEQLLEMTKEMVADYIPGGTLALLGPELFDNLQSGNWMDAMYNALDIVLNEAEYCLPAAKVASFALGAVVNAKHLSKMYSAFKKMKVLGDDVVSKLYSVVKGKLGDDIFKKFKWVNNSHGANITDVGDPLDFWDELVSIFGGNVSGGNGNELVLKDIPGLPTLTIKFYSSSTTPPHCPTISFKLTNNFEFKIRFCE